MANETPKSHDISKTRAYDGALNSTKTGEFQSEFWISGAGKLNGWELGGKVRLFTLL